MSGNDEVMFKASTNNGKTFSDKMNLSNSPKGEPQDVKIAAVGITSMLDGRREIKYQMNQY
jgi:hypothetical protein